MQAILDFLEEIGIDVELTDLPDDTFLPGLTMQDGRLLVDETKLAYPGDLLHEAGHIAVEGPEIEMRELEVAAELWSYAAALAIGLDPAVVFHEGGYHGKSRDLLRTFGYGVYPGLPYLEQAGMAVGPRRAQDLGTEPFPHMLHWLRSTTGVTTHG
jgi:hypothetical protein